TYDGLCIEPLYERDPSAMPIPGRAPGAPWQVLARVDHPDAAAANAEARHEIENGATGLSLVFAGAIGSYGYGIQPAPHSVSRALVKISPLSPPAGCRPAAATRPPRGVWGRGPNAPFRLRGTFGSVSSRAGEGRLPAAARCLGGSGPHRLQPP